MAGRRLFVKVCGITSPEDARLVAEAGADAVGFVFWPQSPRCVDALRARAIGEALPAGVVRVGVFVDAALGDVVRVADEARLDVLQLHGNEPPDDLPALPRRTWKAIRVGPGFVAADALRYEGRAAGLLLDTRSAEAPGGTGRSFDWALAADVRRRASFLMLAGGLDALNVRAAIRAVQPDGVDVSSGVESGPGRKDPEKVRAFLRAAREAS
jgi:phosphoribosylanthranilate isomerase